MVGGGLVNPSQLVVSKPMIRFIWIGERGAVGVLCGKIFSYHRMMIHARRLLTDFLFHWSADTRGAISE
jgi:hypothetical protein